MGIYRETGLKCVALILSYSYIAASYITLPPPLSSPFYFRIRIQSRERVMIVWIHGNATCQERRLVASMPRSNAGYARSFISLDS